MGEPMTFHDAEMPGDLLTRIKAQISSMSRSDVKIARKLLEAPSEFAVSSVRAIADAIGVSEPTVVRFCRNVGCDGFKDLKFQLTRELAFEQARADASTAISGRRADTGLNLAAGGPAADNQQRHVYAQAAEALGATFVAATSSPALAEAAQVIAGGRRILIYGIGGSSAILAEEIHNRLFRLGVSSTCYTDSYAQRMSAATLGEGDVALFVTSTGRPRSLQDSLELAKYYGAKTVAISDIESPIGRDADICIHVGLSQAGVHEFQPNPMRYGQLLVIDLLSFQVAEALGPEAKRVLRQTRASIASLHGIAPQQPIGD